MALDQFVLWVNATSPYKSAAELLAALRAGAPGSFKLGGTGSKQEDQLISLMLETVTATRITYVPLKGGGDVARALAAREVDLSVNHPIEAEQLWRSGAVRPLCVFDGQRLAATTKAPSGAGWGDLPTCMSAGIPVKYQMMRGIFTTPGATPQQVAYYNQLLEAVGGLAAAGLVQRFGQAGGLVAASAFHQNPGPGASRRADRHGQHHGGGGNAALLARQA